MWAFFTGWRRKVGIILLVGACAVFAVWMRSTFTWDYLAFDIGKQQQIFLARDGWIMWCSFLDEIDDGLIGTIPQSIQAEFTAEFGLLRDRPDYHELSVPFWPAILSIALLSACLLLWKPQRSQTSPVIQSPQE